MAITPNDHPLYVSEREQLNHSDYATPEDHTGLPVHDQHVGDQGHDSRTEEGTEVDEANLPGYDVADHQSQLSHHHEVDERLLAGRVEFRESLTLLGAVAQSLQQLHHLCELVLTHVFELILLPLPLRKYVLLLTLVGDVVAQAHANGLTEGGGEGHSHQDVVLEVDGVGAEDDGEDIDSPVEPAVDERFDELTHLHVFFRVGGRGGLARRLRHQRHLDLLH